MVMTSVSFELALEKGEYAESIIREYLEGFGYVVYFPFTKDRAHAFDMLATLGKDKVIALDVKAKARMNAWSMTGINKRCWLDYSAFSKTCSVPFKLVFVDEHPDEMRVYGQDIAVLGEPERIVQNGKIVLWSLSNMTEMFRLTEDQVKKLSALSQRNYEYK